MNMEILVFWTKPLKTFSVNKYKFSTEESIHTSELLDEWRWGTRSVSQLRHNQTQYCDFHLFIYLFKSATKYTSWGLSCFFKVKNIFNVLAPKWQSQGSVSMVLGSLPSDMIF